MCEDKALNILEELRQAYKESGLSNYVNTMLYGSMGTGKTTALRTAVKPVLIHSFDPGGSKVLSKEIEKGEIVVDSRYEQEDARQPSVYRQWETNFNKLKRDKIFESVGTYALDSITLFSESMMNEILRRNGRAGTTPQLQDYMVQITTIKQYIAIIANLPCHTVICGHVEADKDELTGRMLTSIMVTGKLKERLPILLDEIYMTTTKENAKGIEYQFLTRNTGLYKARTRIGSNAKFDTYEEPNLKALLKKAGYSTEDKPLFPQTNG